jgi:acyl-CoA thioester hydrolase
MGFHHEIPVRYGEVDAQRVVFNAHYLAYVDDAMECWMRRLDRDFEGLGWDFMVKRAELVWHGSAGIGDVLEVDSAVTRWGTTSFDVEHRLHVGAREVATVVTTYVGVEPGTSVTTPPPDAVRRHLGEPSVPG